LVKGVEKDQPEQEKEGEDWEFNKQKMPVKFSDVDYHYFVTY
jgi:hypothetical protein